MNSTFGLDTFAAAAEAFGVSLNATQTAQFESYATLLADWNSRIDLTNVPNADFGTRHFLDSLSVQKAVAMGDYKSLCDVGTGAGFPGIPLKIAFPHLTLLLVDATRKRVEFLQAVIEALKLSDTTVVQSRAEDLARDKQYRERFEVVAARAVAKLPELSEYLLPLVALKGVMVAMKGGEITAELQEAQSTITALGGAPPEVVTFPVGDAARSIVVVKKLRSTPTKYPRPTAIIKKGGAVKSGGVVF